MSDKSTMTVEQEMKFIQEKSDKLEKQITGYRTLGKRDTTILIIAAGLFGLFHLYTACAGLFTAMIQRSVHLSFALSICMWKFSANRNSGAKKEPYGPFVFLGLGTFITIFLTFYVKRITAPAPVHLAYAAVITALCIIAYRLTKKSRIKRNEEVETKVY